MLLLSTKIVQMYVPGVLSYFSEKIYFNTILGNVVIQKIDFFYQSSFNVVIEVY